LTWSKLYRNENIPPHEKNPCGSFWWKDVLKLFPKFRSFASASLGRVTPPLFGLTIGQDNRWKGFFLIY
jgi:hypothetical protein